MGTRYSKYERSTGEFPWLSGWELLWLYIGHFPCLLHSFASEACSAAAPVSLQPYALLWHPSRLQHRSGFLKNTSQGPCGLRKGKLSAAHICSAKPPSIFPAESQSGQPRNDVLLLACCCCCLGFLGLQHRSGRASRTGLCPASAPAEHSIKEVMVFPYHPSALMAIGAMD